MKGQWVAVVCLATVGAALLGQPPRRDCEAPDKTTPKALRTSLNDPNDFQRGQAVTDVEKNGRVNTFIRFIHNDHEKNVLPVTWEKAYLKYAELKPGKCWDNWFQSSHKIKEDPQAEVKVGLRGDRTVQASLYLPETPQPQKKNGGNVGGSFTFQEEKEEDATKVPQVEYPTLKAAVKTNDVSFNFESSVEGPSLKYVAWSSSSRLVFEAPQLTKSLSDLVNSNGGKMVEMWRLVQENDKLVIPGTSPVDRRATTRAQFDVLPPLVERQVQVILYKEGVSHPEATGLVSVYLPPRKGKR
jgi:hypothetical protein